MIQGSKTVLRRNIVNRAIVKDDKGSWVLNLQDPYFEQVQSNWRSQRDRTREQTMPYLLAEGHWKGKLPQAIAAGQAWENQDGSVSWLEVERVADKGSSKGNNFRGSITGMDDASKNKIQGMMDKMNRPAITSGGDGDDNIGLTIYGKGGAKGGWGKDGGKDTGKGGWYGGKDGGWGFDFGCGNKGVGGLARTTAAGAPGALALATVRRTAALARATDDLRLQTLLRTRSLQLPNTTRTR